MAGTVPGDPMLNRRASEQFVTADGCGVDVDRLFRDHHVRLVRLASAITLDRTCAEDIVQDAFSGLHRRRDAVENPEGYLQRSVVNFSIKVQRRRLVALRYRPDPPAFVGIPEIDEMWAAVRRLPARQRAVVALRFWEDLSEADIAATLDWPAGTVKSTLHRALIQLKREIER